MNIVFISHEISDTTLLGSSLSLDNMINSIRQYCDNIYIVTPNKGKAFNYFSAKGYCCIAVPFKKATISTKNIYRNILVYLPKLVVYLLCNLYCLIRLQIFFCNKNISIVHSNSSVIDFGYYLSKVIHAQHVWHIREFQDLDFSMKPFFGWNYLHHLIKKSAYSISITEPIAKHHKLLGLKNNIILNDAVRKRTEVFNLWPKKKFFLFCGHICKAKGADLAIKAFSQFCESTNDVKDYRLILCGHYSECFKKELLSINNQINNRIEFLGYQLDVSIYYKEATAFLMCSDNEGLGRVTIEAMFYGCPIIGRNSGGTRFLLSDGKNGFPFNSIEECVKAMKTVVSDELLTREKVATAQAFAINAFSEEVYGKKIVGIYHNILENV